MARAGTVIKGSTSGITGEYKAFSFNNIPSTYLVCLGQAVSRTTYAALFAVLGTTHGIGDGSTTFNLPLCAGRVPRGIDPNVVADGASLQRGGPIGGTYGVAGASTVSGSPTVTVADTSNMGVGQSVSGTNIPASSVIGAITSTTTFTLRNINNTATVNATGTGSGISLTISRSAVGPYPGSIQDDTVVDHSHQINIPMYGNAPAVTSQPAASAAGFSSLYNVTSSTGINSGQGGQGETRMRNYNQVVCIKV